MAGGAAVAVACAAGFGPLVRARAADAAARYGAALEIAAVRPAWDGVRLRGLQVRLEDAGGLRIALDEVLVTGLVLGDRSVVVRGGDVVAVGEPADLAAQLAKVRARAASPGASGGGSGRKLRAEGLRCTWEASGGAAERVRAEGVTIEPRDGGLRAEVGSAELSGRGAVGRLRGLEIEVVRADAGPRLRLVAASEAELDLTGRERAAEAGAPSSARDASTAAGIAAPLRALREKAAVGARLLGEALTDDARLEVGALTTRLRVREETMTIGPGRFELSRASGPPPSLVAKVVRAPSDASARGLSLSLTVPHGEGSERAPIVLETRGGPIPLGALGLHEGDLGLVDPGSAWLEADATITVDEVARAVRFEGEGRVRGLSFEHAAVADRPIRGLDLGFRGSLAASLDGSMVEVAKGQVEVGALHASVSGRVDRKVTPGRPTDWLVDARWEVPLVPCQALLDAAPAGLLPLVAGSTMAGSLAQKGTARFDTSKLDATYDVRWDSAVGCRMVAPRPEIAVERFQKVFKKLVYTPEGETRDAELGPGTESWVPGSRVTHLMEVAVVTAEDGRFHRHGGFDHEAIRNSIRENLRSRRFVRGASTISMQLAKNLYLPRDKTLSRKLEEAILTLYLEQVLTKEQIIELYLNVVEFGPMVYGIGPAAQHYFRTSPGALTVSQAFYLASILPSPRKQHFSPGGAVTGAWMGHLRRLMKYAHHRGRLTDAELDEGLTEVPVFGSPSPAREPAADEAAAGDADAPRREPWDEGDG